MENFKTTSSESKQPYNPIKEEQLYLTEKGTNNAKLDLLGGNNLKLGIQFPIYAGWYRIGGDNGCTEFSISQKPRWLHRKFCQLLLGWEWIDNENHES